jgi:hypothetical protein
MMDGVPSFLVSPCGSWRYNGRLRVLATLQSTVLYCTVQSCPSDLGTMSRSARRLCSSIPSTRQQVSLLSLAGMMGLDGTSPAQYSQRSDTRAVSRQAGCLHSEGRKREGGVSFASAPVASVG